MAESLKWLHRKQRLEALNSAYPSQRQHEPARLDKIMDPKLFSVAKEGDVDKFIQALEDHCAKERVSLPVLLGLRSPCGNTLLHAAAENDDNFIAIIGFVSEDLIFSKNSRKETLLHIAARAGKTNPVQLLCLAENGIQREFDLKGDSALHEAVRNRHQEVIYELVHKDPNLPYWKIGRSKSPLCLAVEIGDLEVLKVLLRAPNDIEHQGRSVSGSDSGMSPVHAAIIYRRMDMLTEMWEWKPWLFQWTDAENGTPLHLAAYKNDLDGVKFLMERCPTSALKKLGGDLPIHVACMMDHVRIVEELLQQWPDPAEFLTRQGQNILHVSARYGSTATVKYILKSPKIRHIINARDFDGNTPLHLAALHWQPTVVLLARDSRVDNRIVNKENMTALDQLWQDKNELFPPLGKLLTRIILQSVGTPRSEEPVIPELTSWSLEVPPARELSKEKVNTLAVVAALVASVTYTSGFIIPGGYTDSERNAGLPMLFRGASAHSTFVIGNFIAMYSSIMALVILPWSQTNDPHLEIRAIYLSTVALMVAITAMGLAFVAGVYVGVITHTGLSLFVFFWGILSVFLITCSLCLLLLPYGRRHPVIRFFAHKIIY